MSDNCGCGETPDYVESPIPVKSGWSPDPMAPTGNPLVDRLTGAANNPQSLVAGMGFGPGAQPSSPTDSIKQLLATGMQPLAMQGRNPLAERIARGGSQLPAPPQMDMPTSPFGQQLPPGIQLPMMPPGMGNMLPPGMMGQQRPGMLPGMGY
jgi:hypothetical protein